MFFVSRQRKIEGQIREYCEAVKTCVMGFHEALKHYCTAPDRERLQANFQEVHRLESRADDVRREIEVLMYSKGIFPESRGDILGLLEALDEVPNEAEAVLRMLYTHRVKIPEVFTAGVVELAGIALRCVAALLEGVGTLFSDFTQATESVGRVDELESEADHVQYSLYERIFASDLGALETILLRDTVEDIGALCDLAEQVGDRIRIIVAKRRA